MKVIISTRTIYPFHGYGGMERYFYSLAHHLVKQGVEVEILTSLSESKEGGQNYKGIKYVFVPPNFKRVKSLPIFYLNYHYFNFTTYRYLKDADFDILHGCGGVLDYLLFNKKKPVIFQPFGLEQFKGGTISRIYNFMASFPFTAYAVKHADAIASEGDLQSREIMELFKVPKEKIFIFPDGVELDFIQKCISSSKITREELGIQDAGLVLINVNRLAPNKGVNYLIDALWILNNQNKLNTKLILVGTGPEEPKIKEQIKKLRLEDKVIHFKNIPDEKMFQLYTLADVSVSPTLYEGLPLVILEAMACGKPIVASNVSEVPQVVKHGENGFLVPPRDPEAIVDAILRIYEENLFRKMGSKSKEIVKDYDWNIIAKKAISKYEELIKR
jgi:glycosyltransferase involved in cell wall biosynthesis